MSLGVPPKPTMSLALTPTCRRGGTSCVLPALVAGCCHLSANNHTRRTIAGVRSFIVGAPSCCMATRVSARKMSSTRSTPA
jgi:hypothetical protein